MSDIAIVLRCILILHTAVNLYGPLLYIDTVDCGRLILPTAVY